MDGNGDRAIGGASEAFFDPIYVTSTAAVGADASNGVLKPTAFSSGGATTTIAGVGWASRRVSIDASASLPAGHHVDFLSLDGSVALRLGVDDAVDTAKTGGGRSMSWGGCAQPWKGGDKLMLRISRSPADLAAKTATSTLVCGRQPAFSTSTYRFSVPENVAVGHKVGTVSATDPDAGDTVAYSITAGNGGGMFSMATSTGAVTVAKSLDYETTSSYSLTVKASDGHGGAATTTVSISVTDVLEGAPAPTGLTASYRFGSFAVSWNPVTGTTSYQVEYRSQGGSWIREGQYSQTWTQFSPGVGVEFPCGATYEFRVRAYGNGTAYTAAWGSYSAVASAPTASCDEDDFGGIGGEEES